MRSFRLAFFASSLFLMSFAGCESANHYLGSCDETLDCHTLRNNQPSGSICNEEKSKCECPIGTIPCCPYAPPGECVEVETCSPADAARCNADAGTASDQECTEDVQCPQPPNKACGKGACVAGRCELTIDPGPTPSQLYGDCVRRECNEKGELVVAGDDLDFYNDANSCTTDYCQGGKTVHLAWPDGTPCAQPTGQGYCFQAQCVECIASMPGATCGGNGIVCTKFWCEPFAQCSNASCGGDCAPCGAGSPCAVGSDCVSNSCVNGMCAIPSCDDNARNGQETDVDCGGTECNACPVGFDCTWPTDCVSSVCKAGICQAPTCKDAKMNGEESGIDCGGSCGPC